MIRYPVRSGPVNRIGSPDPVRSGPVSKIPIRSAPTSNNVTYLQTKNLYDWKWQAITWKNNNKLYKKQIDWLDNEKFLT